MSEAGDGELVSVVIAAFNSETYLADAITSVAEQDWEPLEVIVVDDGSTDGTRAVANRFSPPVRIVEGGDDGLAATRNRGTAVARGAYVLHLDADDLLAPGSIRRLMETFRTGDPCDIAAGRFVSFVSPDLPGAVAARFAASSQPQRGHLSGVAVVRADVFARVGPLDESYQPASDMEWWLRAGQQGTRIRLIDEVILRRRIHGNNASLRDGDAHRQATLKVARAARLRNRTGGV